MGNGRKIRFEHVGWDFGEEAVALRVGVGEDGERGRRRQGCCCPGPGPSRRAGGRPGKSPKNLRGFWRGFTLDNKMNTATISGSVPGQIAAEVAEMRKAAREIAASPRKRLEFLRQVGVLNSTGKRQRSKEKIAAATRHN